MKKRSKSLQGAPLRKKMYETRMMDRNQQKSQRTGRLIILGAMPIRLIMTNLIPGSPSQKPIFIRQNRIRFLRKMQHRKMWIIVKRLEA